MYGAKKLQNFCELAVCVGLFINLKSHTSILTDSLAMISARLQLSHTTPPQKMFGFFSNRIEMVDGVVLMSRLTSS